MFKNNNWYIKRENNTIYIENKISGSITSVVITRNNKVLYDYTPSVIYPKYIIKVINKMARG